MKFGTTRSSFTKTVTQDTLSQFSWRDVFEEIKLRLPLLHSALCGVVTSRVNENVKLNIHGEKFGSAVPIVGMASAVLLYGRKSRKYCFLQDMCALEMWKSGADKKLFQCFQTLGICKGAKGAKNCVDRLVKEFDREIISWKKEIENNMREFADEEIDEEHEEIDGEDEEIDEEREEKDEEQSEANGSPDLWDLLPPNLTPKQRDRNNNADPGTYRPLIPLSPVQQCKNNTGPGSYSPQMDLSPTEIENNMREFADEEIDEEHEEIDGEDEEIDEEREEKDEEQSEANGSPDLWDLLPPNLTPKQRDRNNNADPGTYRPLIPLSPVQQGKNNTDPGSYSPPMDLSPTSEDLEWIRYPSISNTPDDIDAMLFPEDPIPRYEDATDNEEATENPGFCLVWDNVGLMSTTRHHMTDKQNKMHLWALAFAAQNRIGFNHLLSQETVRAQDIALHLFLPTKDDNNLLRNRMEIIVQRILKDHMNVFADCDVCEHITHDYSTESASKSRIINLGVIDADPSSIPGTIKIMDHLQAYVPTSANRLHTIPTHGDGLSVERMRDAKATRAPSLTARDRLEGLEPVPQEWHKRNLVMQDTYNTFYKGNSGADRGTMFHIRNTFGHRNVTKEVTKSFNYNAELLEFTTRGLTVLLAKNLIEEILQTQGNMDMELMIQKVAKEVVSSVWVELPGEAIDSVLDAEPEEDDDFYDFCFCKEDTNEEMICCSNRQCLNGKWFHVGCVDVDTGALADEDWWCSQECTETKMSIFCDCKTVIEREANVRCSNGTNCIGYKQYHLKCLGLSRLPAGRWVCRHCKDNDNDERKDHVYIYTCALVFEGLKDLVVRDQVRENDGPGMLASWRLLVPQLWEKGHNKYLILAHKLIADVHGFQPPRIREEITWNRTASIRGGDGTNIPLDLVNEFLNRDFKENLKRSKGQYSGVNAARTSQFVGTLGRDLDRVFQKKVCGTWVSTGSNRDDTQFNKDVEKFVRLYRDANLCSKVPGREHSAFPGFEYSYHIRNPGKLKQRLKKYSAKLDLSRRILPY